MTQRIFIPFSCQAQIRGFVDYTRDNLPECALIGFAVTGELEIIFDKSNTTRKYENLVKNPSVATTLWLALHRGLSFFQLLYLRSASVGDRISNIPLERKTYRYLRYVMTSMVLLIGFTIVRLNKHDDKY